MKVLPKEIDADQEIKILKKAHKSLLFVGFFHLPKSEAVI